MYLALAIYKYSMVIYIVNVSTLNRVASHPIHPLDSNMYYILYIGLKAFYDPKEDLLPDVSVPASTSDHVPQVDSLLVQQPTQQVSPPQDRDMHQSELVSCMNIKIVNNRVVICSPHK